MEQSIDSYLSDLGRSLRMDSAERDSIIREVRGHLEEKTATYVASGMDRLLAEQEAIRAFGEPHLLARRLCAVHPLRWGMKRAIGASLLGGALAWVLWTATAFPLGVNDEVLQIAYGATPISPLRLLVLSTPISTYGMYHLLHPWLLPVLLLYLAPPFVWGVAARQWWVPGLAYGLGGVLTNPWSFAILRQATFVPSIFYAVSLLVLVTLPLAILASGLGTLWRLISPRLIANSHAVVGWQHMARTALPRLPEQMATLQSQRSSGELLTQRSLSIAWVVVALLGIAILVLQVFSFLRLWAVR